MRISFVCMSAIQYNNTINNSSYVIQVKYQNECAYTMSKETKLNIKSNVIKIILCLQCSSEGRMTVNISLIICVRRSLKANKARTEVIMNYSTA